MSTHFWTIFKGILVNIWLLSARAFTAKLQLLIVHGPNKRLKRVTKKSVVIRWAVNKKWSSNIYFLELIMLLISGRGIWLRWAVFLHSTEYYEFLSVCMQICVKILHGTIWVTKNSLKIGWRTLHTLNKLSLGDIINGDIVSQARLG